MDEKNVPNPKDPKAVDQKDVYNKDVKDSKDVNDSKVAKDNTVVKDASVNLNAKDVKDTNDGTDVNDTGVKGTDDVGDTNVNGTDDVKDTEDVKDAPQPPKEELPKEWVGKYIVVRDAVGPFVQGDIVSEDQLQKQLNRLLDLGVIAPIESEEQVTELRKMG